MRTTIALLFVGSVTIFAQHRGAVNLQRVPPSMAYHRVWAVTPLVGTGKAGDPVRPMFVPAPPAPGAGGGSTAQAGRPNLLGYQMQMSDDKKFALVEYVFQSPPAFQAVLQQEAAARAIAVSPAAVRPANAPGLAAASPAQVALEAAVPGLKIFERGKATDAEILAEFQKHKKNFTFGVWTVRPQ